MDERTANRIERHEITGREMWLELRKQDVTASVVGALFGIHPYETLAGLYHQKRGIIMPAVDEQSVMIRRGRLFENAVAAAVSEQRRDWHLQKAAEYFRDPKARLGATPDFHIFNGKRGVLQTKVVSPSAFKKSWDEVTAPFWIVMQTSVETFLTDSDFGAIAALVVGDYKLDLHIYELPRHAGAEKRIRTAVRNFWQDVADGIEPKIDYERDSALLSLMFPREVPGKVVDLRGDNRLPELLKQDDELNKEIAELESNREKIRTEIREKIGDAESAMVPGDWRVSLKAQARKSYKPIPINETIQKVMTYAAQLGLATDELYFCSRKETSSRVLRVLRTSREQDQRDMT